MKALKVLGTILLGIITFNLVIIFGVLTSVRILFSGSNLGNIMKDVAKEEGTINIGDILTSNVEISASELTNKLEEFDEYVSLDEVYKELGKIAHDILLYSTGQTDDINVKGFKKVLKKAATKYEEKTGEKVDIDEIYESLDNSIKEFKHDLKTSSKEDRKNLELVGSLIGNKTYFGVLIGIIVCCGLMILINKGVKPVCIVFIISSVIGIAINGIFFVASKFLDAEGNAMNAAIYNNMGSILLKTILCFVAILIISIVGIVLSSKKKQVITT